MATEQIEPSDDLESLGAFLGTETGADGGLVSESEVSAPGEEPVPVEEPEKPAEAAPEPEAAAEPEKAEEPAAEAAPELEAPAVPEGPSREEQIANAVRGYRTRHSRRDELRQALGQEQARREELEKRDKFYQEMFTTLQAKTKETAEGEQERALTEDPDAVFREANEKLMEHIRGLEKRLDERDSQETEYTQRVQQQQARYQQVQEDAAQWAQDSPPGFFGEYDEQGQMVRPGVYEAWRDTYARQLVAAGEPRQNIGARLNQKIDHFYQLAEAQGGHPMQFLEWHAAALGVGQEAPAQAQPTPPPAPPPSPAAETIATANAAQKAGLAGSIGEGATSTPEGTPASIDEMIAAGITGAQYAEMLTKKMESHDTEAILNQLLAMEGRAV